MSERLNAHSNFSKGSEWRKWDLHFHTPSSYDYHDKSITDEEIIKTLCDNKISVVCITDHNTIDTIRIKNLQILGKDKVIVLPGIEFCSELGGSESIHFIGVFPENSDIESIWTKLQGKLNLTPGDIVKKGGHDKIQCPLVATCDIIHGLGGITSIHAGTKTNTVESIKNNFLVKKEQKTNILSEYIDILELGKPDDANGYELIVFKSIKLELPMIICSDNHSIKDYKIKSNCWIKADPTFEGLRQIIYEPKNRVFIGSEKPDMFRENCIDSITVEKNWFPQKTLPLNKGLVTIIGARGSGKTALLDFIALGANAHDMCKAGFLYKAQEELKSLKVKISIDGKEKSQLFYPHRKSLDDSLVKYLSQQFVESRCSENGSTILLQAEIEQFIFDNIDEIDRRGTSNFSELRENLFQFHESNINIYKNKISELNREISNIQRLQNNELPIKRTEKSKKELELKELEKKLPKLDKRIKNKSLDDYKKTDDCKAKLESELKIEQSKIKELEQINNEILIFNQTIHERNKYFKDRLVNFGIDEKVIPDFDISYSDSFINYISNLLDKKKNEFNKKVGDAKSPVEGTYRYLTNKLLKIQQERDAYTDNEKRYLDISNRINQTNIAIKEIDVQIKQMENLNKENVQKERINTYQQIFDEVLKKKTVLESLYEPLIKQLEKNDKEKQLGFFVKINVDLKTWASKGEELIDLRKAKMFSDHDKLYEIVKEKLYIAWENCNSALIGKAIEEFTNNEAREMSKNLCESISLVDLADWLFSIDHIIISYELTFNGVPLKLLSPGTKGVLLMLLYLVVDKHDTRSLLIDQPEDNLDPKSVYNNLVPYFIEAKKRRQIIMVTHNPNLVVATDSDQVIIANCDSKDSNKLPTFYYYGGGLENQEIEKNICDILEGGKEAFASRARRYFDYSKEKQNNA